MSRDILSVASLVIGGIGVVVGFYQAYIMRRERKIIREWGMDIRKRISAEARDLSKLAQKVKELRPDEVRSFRVTISDEISDRQRAAAQIRDSIDAFLAATDAIKREDLPGNED